MRQCRFLDYNKYTFLRGDADDGEDYAGVGAGGIQDISVLSAHFAGNLKQL